MTRRAGLSWPVFITSVAIGVAIFILAMVVIGVRYDSGPILPDEPSAEEVARQNAADSYYLLAEAAGADDTYADIADMAESHLEAAGGMWVPWPEGPPEEVTNPPEPQSSSTEVIDLLAESIDATEETLLETSPANAPLYASILLRQEIAYQSLSSDEEEPTGGMTVDPLTPAQVTELAGQNTLSELDTARQWLETAAPYLESNDRALARIEDLKGYTSEILDSGVADTREAFAPLPGWFLEDPSPETAQRLEADAYRLVARELFTFIPTLEKLDAEIVATAVQFLSPSMRAELSNFPLLDAGE